MSQERVDRAIYLKSGSYWVVKRNKWIGPFKAIEAARLARDETEVVQSKKPQGGPFIDFVEKQWIPLYSDKKRTNTKLSNVETLKRIYPYFASKRMAEITKLDILQWMRQLTEKGYANQTVNATLVLMRGIMGKAIDLGYLTKNPCDLRDKLRIDLKHRHVITEREIVELVNKIDHPYKYAVALGGLAGARGGEVMAFQWDDFDLGDKPTISFRRSINRIGKVDELKTDASASKIPMMMALRDLLLQWKKDCPDDTWLFQGKVRDYVLNHRRYTKDGVTTIRNYHLKGGKTSYGDSALLSGWWIENRKKFNMGLDTMRFHDLRHSFATNIANRVTQVKMAQKLCRHANVQTTLTIYAQVRPETMEEVWTWTF